MITALLTALVIGALAAAAVLTYRLAGPPIPPRAGDHRAPPPGRHRRDRVCTNPSLRRTTR